MSAACDFSTVVGTLGPNVVAGGSNPCGATIPSDNSCTVACAAGYDEDDGDSTLVCNDGSVSVAPTLACLQGDFHPLLWITLPTRLLLLLLFFFGLLVVNICAA